ncbi:MAG TPA: hypothetical protein VKA27_10965 [Sunxiuqinia sp.]|nr:hypothetical protein [Sunxiuqinia sp.]
MKKLLVVIAMAVVTMAASAQPNFSGSWKLNTSKSKLNDQWTMAPKSIDINQSDNQLGVDKHVSFQDNDFTISDKFTLDGKECINKGWRDTEKKSKANWSDDKKSLTIDSTLPMRDGGDMTIKETYQMDDKTLVLVSHVSSSYGEVEERMVYDKQ